MVQFCMRMLFLSVQNYKNCIFATETTLSSVRCVPPMPHIIKNWILTFAECFPKKEEDTLFSVGTDSNVDCTGQLKRKLQNSENCTWGTAEALFLSQGETVVQRLQYKVRKSANANTGSISCQSKIYRMSKNISRLCVRIIPNVLLDMQEKWYILCKKIKVKAVVGSN